MRPSSSLLISAIAACTACAIAQERAVLKPEAKLLSVGKLRFAPPAMEIAPPDLETKPDGPRSELSAKGSRLGIAVFPSRYVSLLTEAMRHHQARDFKGAGYFVDRADEILRPTAVSLNVRGAIAIELRDFDRGCKFCTDSLKLDPNFFPAKFNICEIPFLEGKFAEARGLWQKLLATLRRDDSSGELVIYRIILTYVLENDFDRAKGWLEILPFPSQTPAYQYAHAVWARQKGDMAKWDEWNRIAAYAWPAEKRAEYVDVLIHLGWIMP